MDRVQNHLQILKSLGFAVLEGSADSVDAVLADPPSDHASSYSEPTAPVHARASGARLEIGECAELLEGIAGAIGRCESCRLCHSRANVVPGEGSPVADLMFVGEGPGADEDRQGRPFVGRAGELLTRIIGAMGFRREDVFIANVVKCRPPGNRTPEPDEMETCLSYLVQQIEIIRPRVIVTLGKTALAGLLPEHGNTGITKIRGGWLEWREIAVMPTFHPAYLLRSPAQKRFVWEDMQKVMKVFGKEPDQK